MKRFAAFLPLLGILAFGCNQDRVSKSSSSGSDSTPATTGTVAPGKDAPAVSNTSPDKSAKPSTEVKAPILPKLADMPANLKHAGFEYEGLSCTKPIDMELVVSTTKNVTTGSQTVTFKELKDGKATFDVERTGQLNILGTDVVSVEPDGIFAVSSSVAKLSPHAMELPANPKPGMTWKFHASVDNPTAQMDVETTCKIVGIQKITTKGGSYPEALLVEQDSVGTLQKEKVRTVARNWYVKGLGVVKAELKTTRAKGKDETLTIQETHH